jgi:hypothetical protein
VLFGSGEPNYCELLVAPAFSGVSQRLSADRDKSDIGNTAQVTAAVENRRRSNFVETAIHSEQLTSTALARDQIVVVAARTTVLKRANHA